MKVANNIEVMIRDLKASHHNSEISISIDYKRYTHFSETEMSYKLWVSNGVFCGDNLSFKDLKTKVSELCK